MKNTKSKVCWSVVQAVNHLPGECKALSSNLSTEKQQKYTSLAKSDIGLKGKNRKRYTK
jgi:hypothetical protein